MTFRWFDAPQDYAAIWHAMRQFTDARGPETQDEIWLLQHHPVFTQGQNGQAEHVLDLGDIALIKTDRGGQVTYHGPGQLMIYTLIDLKRQQFGIRDLVSALEQTVIDLLAAYAVTAYGKRDAPGVYVDLTNPLTHQAEPHKLASIGLRVRRGFTYHGMALNINMDLTPFNRINPCGFSGLKMTQLATLTPLTTLQEAGSELSKYLTKNLRYTTAHYIHSDG